MTMRMMMRMILANILTKSSRKNNFQLWKTQKRCKTNLDRLKIDTCARRDWNFSSEFLEPTFKADRFSTTRSWAR